MLRVIYLASMLVISTSNETLQQDCIQDTSTNFPYVDKDHNVLLGTLSILLRDRQKCQRDLNATKDKIKNIILRDCSELYQVGSVNDGIYKISPDGITEFDVYCDMVHGGWTIMQRRFDESVNFDRKWNDFVQGFGKLKTNYWLGLEKIHLLTRKPNQILFNLTIEKSGNIATALYSGFTVRGSFTNYTMFVDPDAEYSSNMKKYISSVGGFYYSNGMQFSTKDVDNDKHLNYHCADDGGGWWLKACYQIGYFNTIYYRDMNLSNGTHSWKIINSEIKIRIQ